MTSDDEDVLEAVRKADKQASDTRQEVQKLIHDAERRAQPEATKGMTDVERSVSTASFLAANYTKKDKAAKQESLFPELEEELAKGREALKAGVVWEDQKSEAYQQEVVRRAEPLMNPKLTRSQRTSLITKILRPFSMVFWLAGCKPPRVTGYVADIKLRSDA